MALRIMARALLAVLPAATRAKIQVTRMSALPALAVHTPEAAAALHVQQAQQGSQLQVEQREAGTPSTLQAASAAAGAASSSSAAAATASACSSRVRRRLTWPTAASGHNPVAAVATQQMCQWVVVVLWVAVLLRVHAR